MKPAQVDGVGWGSPEPEVEGLTLTLKASGGTEMTAAGAAVTEYSGRTID